MTNGDKIRALSNEDLADILYSARYVAGVPMIVTTNLTRDELSKAPDITTARTYDRLIEKCVPVEVAGKSRRRAAAAENWGEMREMLGLIGGTK